MADAPVGLSLECGEKRVVHCISNFYDWATNVFAKAFLIADFLTKGDTSNENNLLTQDLNLEDLT